MKCIAKNNIVISFDAFASKSLFYNSVYKIHEAINFYWNLAVEIFIDYLSMFCAMNVGASWFFWLKGSCSIHGTCQPYVAMICSCFWPTPIDIQCYFSVCGFYNSVCSLCRWKIVHPPITRTMNRGNWVALVRFLGHHRHPHLNHWCWKSEAVYTWCNSFIKQQWQLQIPMACNYMVLFIIWKNP